MKLAAAAEPVDLAAWAPLHDGSDGEAAAREAFEEALKSGDRLVVFCLSEGPERTVVRTAASIQRRSKRLHWLTLVGAVHEWLQAWAHNDFEH